jgi:L-ribulokinase
MTAASQTAALGAAMLGAVAAGTAGGGYDTVADAALKMAHLKQQSFIPNPSAQKVYDQLYGEYSALHAYFGRGSNDVMKRLKRLKVASRSSGVATLH